MKLTQIKINRFRNIDTFSGGIGDGIILFKGPNEAGKSSFLSAILFGLFEDPKSSAQRLEDARKWNSQSLYHLGLEFKNNGEAYLLEKDFENQTVLLQNKVTGETWKGKDKVNARLAELIGFYSKEIFTSTACVFQDELNAIHSGQKEIRSLLEQKVAGREESAVQPILTMLEKKILDLKRGIDRPAHVNPGQIRRVVDELTDLAQRRSEIANKVEKLRDARQRVHELSHELDETEKSVSVKKQALEKSKVYVKEKEKCETLTDTLEKIMENLQRLTKAEQQVDILKVQQDGKQEKLKEREANLDKCKAATKTRAEKESLVLELGGKRDILGKATELLGAVTKLKESVAAVPVISEQLTQDLRQKESDIRALEKIIAQRQMLLTVTFKAKTPYVIETEEGLLSEGEGSAGETVQGSAKREFRIDFKDIADVRVSSKDEALEKSIEELGETKATVKEQLAQRQCRSLAEFLEMKESREKKEQELESKEKDLKVTLGKETIESLTKGISELEPRLKELDNALKQAKGFAISEEELTEQEREIQKLRDEVNELNGNIRENQGILKSFSKEQLEKDKKVKAREILVAETALEDLKEFQSSGEEVVKRENELQDLEQRLSALKIEQKSLARTLQEDDYGQEDVAEIEERIDSLERRANRLKTRLRAYEVISEVLGEARQNILKSISGEVDQLIGSYFALITGGKYDQVRLSRDDFSLQVFSEEKGDWINPDTEELSAGARDQLYLAARVALLGAVTGDNSVPLILDDPLVHFDSERRENTRNLLKEVSKKHQVLIFSCHDYYDDWADQVITF